MTSDPGQDPSFRAVLEAASDAMVVIEASGAVVAINGEAERLFDWTEAELAGHPMERLIPPRFQRIHTAQRDSGNASTETQRRASAIPGLGRRRDGTEFPVEITQNRISNGAHTMLLVTIRDITEQRRAQEHLFRQKERALVTLESIGDGIVTTDTAGMIIYLNPVAERLSGWRAAEALGQPLDSVLTLISDATRLPIESMATRCLREGRVVDLPEGMLLLRRDSTEVAISDSAAPILDRNGATVGVVIVFHDVTEKRRVDYKLSHEATHDALTGLVNRNEFERRLARCVADSTADSRAEHAVCFMDLDGFKAVNDTCGHEAGDALLRNISGLLTDVMRRRDTLARLGGDEFGILLEHCALIEAETIANKICGLVKEFRFDWNGEEFGVGISVGVVAVTVTSGRTADVIRAADAACYAAKEAGGDRVHVGRPDDVTGGNREAENRRVARLFRAVELGQFQLFTQPIVPLKAERSARHRFELLLRLPEDRGGMLNAGSFTQQAERYNLMPAIDHWVVNKTIGLLGRWRADHPNCELPLCAINLSQSSLKESFVQAVSEQLAEHRLSPEALCFEITEAAALRNFPQTMHMVSRIRSTGCMVALEDFGRSMTSFSYLRSLPVDFVKIGGHYVRGVAEDRVSGTLVNAVSRIGEIMGISTVAEEVDNEDDLRRLRGLGVVYAQGAAVGAAQSLTDPDGSLVIPCYDRSSLAEAALN